MHLCQIFGLSERSELEARWEQRQKRQRLFHLMYSSFSPPLPPSSSVLHVDSSGEVEGSKLLSDGCWTSRCLSFWQLVVWRHDRDGASSQTWNLHIFSKFDMYPCFRIGINKAADQLFTFSAARCPGQTLTVWQSACFGICSGKCLIPVDTDALIWTVCYCHLVHSYG